MIDPTLASFTLHLAGLTALVVLALGWHRERSLSRQRRRERDDERRHRLRLEHTVRRLKRAAQ